MIYFHSIDLHLLIKKAIYLSNSSTHILTPVKSVCTLQMKSEHGNQLGREASNLTLQDFWKNQN